MTPSLPAFVLALRLGAAFETEVTAGEVPVSTADGSEASASVSAVPRLRAVVGHEQRTRLQLDYFPRAYFRYPDSLRLGRPTLLHQMRVDFASALSRRTNTGIELQLVYGELDFTATRAVFGPEQVEAQEQAVIDIFRAQGNYEIEGWLTRRTRLSLALPAGYQAPLGGAKNSTIPTATNLGMNPKLIHQLTRRDRGLVEASGQYFDVERTPTEHSRFLQTRLSLGWERLLSRTMRGNLGGGISRVDSLPSSESPHASEYLGLAVAGLTEQFRRSSAAVTVALDARVDPVLQAVRPQAHTRLSFNHVLSTQTTLGAAVQASLVTAQRPLASDPNESSVGANLVAGFQLSNAAKLHTGVRALWNGPHWSQGLAPRQRTIVGFVGLTLFHPDDAGF